MDLSRIYMKVKQICQNIFEYIWVFSVLFVDMYIFDEIENSLTWEHKIIRISTRLFPFGDFANIDKYQRRYEKK